MMSSDGLLPAKGGSSLPRRSRLRRSLVTKYAAYAALLVSTLLAASGLVGGYFQWEETTASQAALLSGKVRLVALRIAQFSAEIEHNLRSASTEIGPDESPNVGELRIELIRILRRVPAVTDLKWIDYSGRERILVSRQALDVLNSGRDHSAAAEFRGARATGRYTGPVYFRKGTEPYMRLALAGATAAGGVLVAEVNLTFVSDVVTRERVGDTGIAFVIDARGQLISHTVVSRVLARTDLTALPQIKAAMTQGADSAARSGIANNADGVSVLWASYRIPDSGWIVFAELPAREALAPVYYGLLRTLALVALGIALAVFASVVLARRLVRPIRELEQGAAAIGAGRWEQRISVRSGDELEALGTQFNNMAGRLQEIYATLEARIGERTRELAIANQAKTRFLAAASHDLRQPIHALTLFVGQLKHDTIRDPEIAGLAARMESSVVLLKDLLDALLDVSRLDAGTVVPQMEAFALDVLFDRIEAQFALLAETKGVVLVVHRTSLWVRSDARLLERMLLNLTANAVRYTDHGRIVVGCRRRGTQVEIMVADTGVGIAPEHLPFIFQEFYRAEKTPDNRPDGLGLGLAIVERLGRLCGHAVTVRSRPGSGSTFGIRVPVALSGTPPSGDPASNLQVDDLAGRRILVVDDDPAVRESMAGLLQRWGCLVTVANDGPSAREAVAATVSAPEIAICDLRLGDGENGFEVLDSLRAACGVPPAGILITGDLTSECIAEGNRRGYPVLGKPATPGKVRAIIEYSLRRRAEA